MNEQIVFKSRPEFIQAAFEQVAKIVSDHGEQILECSVPAFDTEKCLKHLSLVALAWSYDPSVIDALEELFKKSNEEIQDYFGDVE